MNWTAIGAIFLALAVMLGAFGAHGLRGRIDEYSLGVYERAVLYHFIHAIGMLVVGMMPRAGVLGTGSAALVCGLLAAGILIFSGSLYLLAVTGTRTLGMITPFGGLSFIGAWIVLAVALLRR